VRPARVRFQLRQHRKIVRRRDCELGGTGAHRPEEHALNQMDVVQAMTKRSVIGRRWMGLNGPPMFGIGPYLVCAEIAK